MDVNPTLKSALDTGSAAKAYLKSVLGKSPQEISEDPDWSKNFISSMMRFQAEADDDLDNDYASVEFLTSTQVEGHSLFWWSLKCRSLLVLRALMELLTHWQELHRSGEILTKPPFEEEWLEQMTLQYENGAAEIANMIARGASDGNEV